MVLLVSKRNPDSKNIDITKEELKQIKSLPDFDLTMFLSELDDFGWERFTNDGKPFGARRTLKLIIDAIRKRN